MFEIPRGSEPLWFFNQDTRPESKEINDAVVSDVVVLRMDWSLHVLCGHHLHEVVLVNWHVVEGSLHRLGN